MKLNSGKPATKTMRVATLFTGIAACTVGGVQAAHAQTTHPAVRSSGSIRTVNSCSGNGTYNTWLHVLTWVYKSPYAWDAVTVDCYGYKGTSRGPRGTGIGAECGGENKGWLLGHSSPSDPPFGNGYVDKSYHFGPGTGYRSFYWPHLDYVEVSGWTGKDQCTGQIP